MMKIAGGVAFLWAFILIYMGLNLFHLAEESHQSNSIVATLNVEVDLLKRENAKLRQDNNEKSSKDLSIKAARASKEYDDEVSIKQTLKLKLQNSEFKLKQLESKLKELETSNGPSRKYEVLQRRIANQIKEMWFYTSAQIGRLRKTAPDTATQDFQRYLDGFREMQQITETDFEKLIAMDGVQSIRDNAATSLSQLVQKRLKNLQNPDDCESARKLVCSLNKGCGYGCQMHHLLYCFIVAYSTKRTLILDASGWRYSRKGWNKYFLPISSKCTHYVQGQEWSKDHASHQVVHLPIVDSMYPRPKQMPLSVPRDLYEQIVSFHGHPFVWWISQFTKYIFKFQPPLDSEIKEKKRLLKFKSPIVGVQVRRTDKINLEAAFHRIEEYMYWVDLYYKKLALTQKLDKKRVFIATDDPTVLPEARKKYPDYEFLSDIDVSKSAGLSSRYSDESLHGVISDIELLSDTDFLVCTFSSQVCRLSYEIMNHKHTDASQLFRSLDDVYYFGGQHEHRMKVIWPHEGKGRSELDLSVGDIIGIAGNHWDGQAKGLHHGQQKSGLFPAYKIEDLHDVEDFPPYEDK